MYVLFTAAESTVPRKRPTQRRQRILDSEGEDQDESDDDESFSEDEKDDSRE